VNATSPQTGMTGSIATTSGCSPALAAIQPSLAAGEADGISFVTQYNPHGLGS
jgi:hypothetical protein